MTTYETRVGDGEIARMLEDERQQTERLVDQLSDQAARQQRKAVEGLIALPAAIALRIATIALRAVALTARGFEIFQRAAMDARREKYRPERERAEAGRQPEQPRA